MCALVIWGTTTIFQGMSAITSFLIFNLPSVFTRSLVMDLHLIFNIFILYVWNNEIWVYGLVHLFYSNLTWLNQVELFRFYRRSCEKRIRPTDGFAAATKSTLLRPTITFCLNLIFLSFILLLCLLALFVCISYEGKLRRKKKKRHCYWFLIRFISLYQRPDTHFPLFFLLLFLFLRQYSAPPPTPPCVNTSSCLLFTTSVLLEFLPCPSFLFVFLPLIQHHFSLSTCCCN